MSDKELLAIYVPLALISLGMIVHVFLRDRHRRLWPDALFMLCMIFGWQVVQVLYHSSQSFELAFWLYDMDLPFIAFASLTAVLFTMRFYSLERYRVPAIYALLLVIPCITLLLSLTPHLHHFLRTLRITAINPIHLGEYELGFWFWVHAAYCYAVTLSACICILVKYHGLPRSYRASSGLLLVGMLGSLAGNVLVILRFTTWELDFSLLGCSVTVFFFWLAMHRNTGLDFLMQARGEVLNRLDKAVLAVDTEGVIVQRNPKANELFAKLGIAQEETSYEAVLSALRAQSRRYGADEEELGTDYFLREGKDALAFNLREKNMTDRRGEKIATLVTCMDVSQNRALIAQLEDEAGLDALTGALNEQSMEVEQALLDAPENLPIGIIVGDVNELRQLNEQMGRTQGDMALRLVADCLVSICPPNARVARVGGDEFRVLLPGCGETWVYGLLHQIRAAIARHPKNFFKVDIAMGIAIKNRPDERMTHALMQADHHMRLEKEAMRGQHEAVQGERGRYTFV